MMEVVVTTGATRSAKLQSSPPTNQHPVFLQDGCPSCHPTNSVCALKASIPQQPGQAATRMLDHSGFYCKRDDAGDVGDN